MGRSRLVPAIAMLIGALGATAVLDAQSMGPARMPPAAVELPLPTPAPSRLHEALNEAPLHSLPPAAVAAADQLAALAAWNAAGRLPLKIGFARALRSPAAVRLDGMPGATADPRAFAGGLLADAGAGQLAWGIHVRVAGAHRLRLHLSDVRLPPATRMWVSAPGGASRDFGLALRSPDGDLWTPSVKGESLIFEVQLPAAAATASFAVREVMELVDLGAGGFAGGAAGPSAASPGDPACVVDSSCVSDSVFPDIDSYRHAMAQVSIIGQGGAFLCSGGLLNDSRSDFIPYLLTSNHCFGDQASASSLEAVFDDFTSLCNGAPPDPSTLPTVNGAALLAASSQSDFTFVVLYSVPAGRTFLGWNADPGALTQDTPLFRLSFPAPGGLQVDPERFSRSLFQTGNGIALCNGAPRPDFIYSTLTQGGTFGSSTGSPLMLGNGQVVGQLLGGCGAIGHDGGDGCDYANSEVDGAFAITFPAIARWLAPPAPLAFFTLPPCRLVDTRGPSGPLGAPALQATSVRLFPLTGACGVPATARALSLNVTVTQATAAGDLRLFPGSLGAPPTSTINFAAGQTRANNAVAALAADGTGALQVQADLAGTVQLVLDVNGYFQ